jgi:hypothetical protein
MLLRTLTLTLTPILTIYFGIHGLISVKVMSLEIAVLAPWYFTSQTKNAGQMARETCKNSLPNMVVCFPFRRKSLPVNVRLL